MRRPNVLIFMSDQHNARCMSGVGHPNVRTPNLDALAERGVRFELAFAQNPICTPSRVSFFSGQYVHNHCYYGLMGPAPNYLPSMFQRFREAGYHIGMVGKIHTPYGWLEKDCHFVRDAYGAHGSARYVDSDFDKYLWALGLLGERDDDRLQEQPPSSKGQSIDARPSRLPYEHSVEGWCIKEAIRFLHERPDDKPFLLWVSVPRPHQIYAPSRQFWDMYPEDAIVPPPNFGDDLHDKPPYVRRRLEQLKTGSWTLFEPRTYEAGYKRVLRGYFGCVTQVDYALGELLKALDELHLRENTIIIYTSDHGEFAGEFGLLEKAPGISFDAVCRIPFIWSWAGNIAEGVTCEELVESIDMYPTLCELVGMDIPHEVDGLSIRPLLEGHSEPLREAAFTECPWSKAVRTKEWRYVYRPRQMFPDANPNDAICELYDMRNDPWQRRNLLYGDVSDEHRRIAEQLKSLLLDWLIKTHRVVTALPIVTPNGEFIGSAPPDFITSDGKISIRQIESLIERQYVNYL